MPIRAEDNEEAPDQGGGFKSLYFRFNNGEEIFAMEVPCKGFVKITMAAEDNDFLEFKDKKKNKFKLYIR